MQLVKKRKRILVICPHPQGYVPGQRLKYEQYFESWRQNGYEVTVSPFMSEKMQQIVYKKGHFAAKILGTADGYCRRFMDLFRIRQYDAAYIFLSVTPFGPPFAEWLFTSLAKKVIYDIDDLVFLKNVQHENRLLGALKGKKKPFFMMRKADHVISCTPYLDSIARQYNQHTTDISSTINTDTYIPVNTYSNDHVPVLGWSGSHSTIRYLYLLKDVLLELRKKINFRLLVIGSQDFDIPGIETEVHAWSAGTEIPLLQQIDIGLYPLPADDPWILGKSGLKALQYMGLGIPTVATRAGCNDRVIENNVSGFLVSTEKEWVEKLSELIADPELRKVIGTNARKRVEQYYSIKANAPTYLSIIRSVAG
jgi:glycosyltransferase involved in cell wall biosynthesis